VTSLHLQRKSKYTYLVKACIVFVVSAGFEKGFHFSILKYPESCPLFIILEATYYIVVHSTNYAILFSEFW